MVKDMIRQRWRSFVIAGLGLLLFYACNGNRRPQADNPVSRFIGSEIQFDGLLSFNMPDGETLASMLKDAQNSIIVYIDSSSCEDCSISRALNIRGFELELKQKLIGDIPFLFIFNTQDIWTLEKRLHDFGFYHYYFVDYESTFLRKNKIPADKRFHTFLLDENNKVVLVGNPSTNQKVRDLYNKVLHCPVNRR
jgi:hypothetical protein